MLVGIIVEANFKRIKVLKVKVQMQKTLEHNRRVHREHLLPTTTNEKKYKLHNLHIIKLSFV